MVGGVQLRPPRCNLRGCAGTRLVGQPSGPLLFRHHFIDGIVYGATEVPDRDDGAPLLWRKDEERIVEAGIPTHASPCLSAYSEPREESGQPAMTPFAMPTMERLPRQATDDGEPCRTRSLRPDPVCA